MCLNSELYTFSHSAHGQEDVLEMDGFFYRKGSVVIYCSQNYGNLVGGGSKSTRMAEVTHENLQYRLVCMLVHAYVLMHWSVVSWRIHDVAMCSFRESTSDMPHR